MSSSNRLLVLPVLITALLLSSLAAAAETPRCAPVVWNAPVGDKGWDVAGANRAALDAERKAAAKKEALAARELARDAAEGARDAAQAALASNASGGDNARWTAAVLDLAAADTALALARLDAECAELEADALSMNARLLEIWRYGFGLSLSAAGGTGGANRMGGSLRFASRVGPSYEIEVGARMDGFDAARDGSRRDFAAGPYARVGFGGRNVGMFLGASPLVVDRDGGASPHFVGQVGARLRAGDDAPAGDVRGFFDARVFVEPWIALDGAPVAVLFGLELGGGLALAAGRWTGPSTTWTMK